jgi:hypothetical protein
LTDNTGTTYAEGLEYLLLKGRTNSTTSNTEVAGIDPGTLVLCCWLGNLLILIAPSFSTETGGVTQQRSV